MCENGNIEKLTLEAYRLSELALDSDEKAAAAADQRANGFFAATLAIAALLASFFDSDSPEYGLLVSAFLFAMAGAFAGYSIRPKDFYFPGAKFELFADDIKINRDFIESISELAQFNDQNSDENKRQLDNNAKLIWIGYRLAFFAATIAFLSHGHAIFQAAKSTIFCQ